MGTVTGPEEPTVGVVQRLGETVRLIEDRVIGTTYGNRTGSLWALLLILVAAIGILIEPDWGDIVGTVALVLLAVWVGGRR